LNTLNQVIDSEDIYHDILKLFIQQPDLVKVIPALMATREHALDLISFDEKDYMETYNLDFKNIDLENIRSYVDFIDQAGLLDFLQANVHYSLVDYMYGVETGLDSNGRKNRSGTTMEIIFETEIKKICEELGVEHKSQATADFISKN
jgi:type II restriction enzyme